jgi:hypothetical protein
LEKEIWVHLLGYKDVSNNNLNVYSLGSMV